LTERPGEFPAPDWLVADARAFYASGAQPVTPRLASTVVLLRPPLEAYAIRRAASMAFAAGMYAFPGGGVDPRDSAAEPAWAGPAAAQWANRLGQPEAAARAIVCAAAREVFEECGVLLAGPDESTVVGDVSGADWEGARVALEARRIGFAELLADRGLVLRSDLLAPWSRWITPDFEPRRYDTYFFLARLPRLQVTRQVGGEADHTVWAHPAQLAGTGYAMLPPTLVTLRQLSAYSTVDEAMAAAGGRDAATAVQPRIDLDRDGGRLLMPF
jgi:8-oxo-dGTP pyrophosphatase MutT (NUDIX family)